MIKLSIGLSGYLYIRSGVKGDIFESFDVTAAGISKSFNYSNYSLLSQIFTQIYVNFRSLQVNAGCSSVTIYPA